MEFYNSKMTYKNMCMYVCMYIIDVCRGTANVISFLFFSQNVQTLAFVLEHHDCIRQSTRSTHKHE